MVNWRESLVTKSELGHLTSMRNKRFITPIYVWLAVAFLSYSSVPIFAQQPVVVELFTSEGCSDCPPADALLGELSREHVEGNAELILLGEHVEYWNHDGWIDRFSGPAYTQRQYDYTKELHLATPYTPQIVVDGHLQGVGNNPTLVHHLIAEASKSPMPSTVSLQFVSPDKLQVTVDGPSSGKQQVFFAVTEDGLTTNIRGGENHGRQLTHSAVVRDLRRLGTTNGGKFETTVKVPAKSDWNKPNLHAIVLVQNADTGLILGAGSLPYSQATPAAAGR